MPWQPTQFSLASVLPASTLATGCGVVSCLSPHPMLETNSIAVSNMPGTSFFNGGYFIELYFKAMRFKEKRCMEKPHGLENNFN
jgi:hypothetical protein